ncbi:E3 ubiquitin-protein ligase RNF146-B-like isoform X2 [Eriocheir sinensis]|uniref:E3 ubiquitin-protein ligase RNF146-B-like isoform X2 n=1 Tax=Eriocheir sinensis TaxID=95602 RepID=UPI0021C7235F|nr:E3 ubiquitin-protein ligase RNF146-B-like isoform X2 [Eriocheir sinensis]
MAEAAGKEEATPGALKEKAEESEVEGKTPQQSQQTQAKDDSEEELECAVCLQKCVHPVRLPCTHIFCFLCVKGVANQSKRCAMCRQEIPADFLDHPTLLSSIEAEKEEVLPGGYQWFYEGRNGWWQYDERTSHELEAAYGSGQRACEVLVAGFLYIIDFDRMVQLRRNDPSRRRRIKRDLSSIPKKGVAGIKLPSQLEAELSALHTAAHAIHIPNHREGEMGDSISPAASNNNNNNDLCPRTPTAPSNTPQTPHTPSAASSSSGSPDTSEATHLHALTADSHHHHYHHHLPSHYQHMHHHNQLHIPNHLTSNLSLGSEHGAFPPPAGQHPRPPVLPSAPHPQPPIHHPTPASSGLREPSGTVIPSAAIPVTEVEETVYQMDQLSLLPDTPEFYPLDGPEETEQYHLTLSSEDE